VERLLALHINKASSFITVTIFSFIMTTVKYTEIINGTVSRN